MTKSKLGYLRRTIHQQEEKINRLGEEVQRGHVYLAQLKAELEREKAKLVPHA